MTKENKSHYAILGILIMGPANGYDIKTVMQISTNHFWSESDRFIHPALKKYITKNYLAILKTSATITN